LGHCASLVSGQHAAATAESVDWEAIAATRGTIVILMGSAGIGEIAARLRRGGLAADTPVAAVDFREPQVAIRRLLH
jgi:siroheme synthase